MSEDNKSIVSNPQLRPYHKCFDREEIIIEEGEKFKALYILVKGKVGVFISGKMIAEIEEAGEYFGEIAVLLKQNYNATVIALERSDLIEIPPEKLETFISYSPKTALSIAKKLAKRLLKVDKQYVEHLIEKHND